MSKLLAMQSSGSKNMKCPNGHALPHRGEGGRCSPLDCAVDANAPKAPDLQELTVYAEQTNLIREAQERTRALDEAFPIGTIPAAPDLKKMGPKEYMRQRLESIAPLALERRIRKMVIDPDGGGDTAASELLDRAGFTRNPDGAIDFGGPVLILRQRFVNPYLKQLEEKKDE